ncbi:MAG: ABC-F family ATP-binding cassette domain-containing protein [Eubacterium sp.]|nr:ABC-F family ATP-binding cassette domain-containing protein [Eubacterium sp.]
MSIISVEGLKKAFGEKKILNDATFGLEEGEKAGVIGINGTGKSTLLKMIAGEEESDDGKIIKANKARVAYLPQIPDFNSDKTIIEYATDDLSDMADGWNLEVKAKDMLIRLGFKDFSQKVNVLSGGEKKKVALVRCLIEPSDILLLDEPTNHLDAAMVRWLEDYLKAYKGTILMVTHDRYFLDIVTSKIIELDHGDVYSYESNYSGFLLLKNKRIEDAINQEKKRQNFLRNELKWVRRGARARTTKQKARLARFEEVSNTCAPVMDEALVLESVASRMGRKTIEINNISKEYGGKVLIKDYTYTALRNDRIGIVGPNGCGKSTLLKMIAGFIQPDKGDISLGETIKIGYFEQEITELENAHQDQRVIDYIRDTAEYIKTPTGYISAAQILENFLFEGEMQYSPLYKLSGGEKRRLKLLKVIMTAPNVLLLDEPTNDLDIATLSVLESFLSSFDGIIITVSHDRYFLDNVVNRIFLFDGSGNIKQYDGNYSDFVEKSGYVMKLKNSDTSAKEGESALIPKSNVGKQTYKPRHEDKLKMSYKEKKEYETIEEDIALLEEKIEKCDAEILKYGSDFVKLRELGDERDRLEKELEEKLSRWEYLEELNDRIINQ